MGTKKLCYVESSEIYNERKYALYMFSITTSFNTNPFCLILRYMYL